jgi:small subunit ribosomal protein S18
MSTPRKTRTSRVMKNRKTPLLAADVTYVDYKDVTLLRTFISERGKIRSRRVTGITPQQQRMVTRAIKNAREMALLPYTNR